MAIIQISKIQVRQGNLVDIPQLSPGEFGWADDQRRLFIGNDSTRPGDPPAPVPNNTEVLTVYSPISGTNVVGNITASGANGDIQYNSNGVMTGANAINITPFTRVQTNDSYIVDLQESEFYVLDTANIHVGVGNIKIGGGTNGQVLSTDGTGNLSWVAGGNGGGGNGVPGGSNSQVQFNNAGAFDGSANFTYNNSSNILTVTNLESANITATTGFTGPLLTNAQPNVTSVGTLTGLTVANSGVVNFTNTSNVALGAAGNLRITGGSAGQFLQYAAGGNTQWSSLSTATSGQIVFSNGASLVGSSTFNYDPTNSRLTVGTNATSGFGSLILQNGASSTTITLDAPSGTVSSNDVDCANITVDNVVSSGNTINVTAYSTTTQMSVVGLNANPSAANTITLTATNGVYTSGTLQVGIQSNLSTYADTVRIGPGYLTVGNTTGTPAANSGEIWASGTITASHADLGEYYHSDEHYEPGTVLDFGGVQEVTLSNSDMSQRVAGVVSTDPAYVMNGAIKDDIKSVILALQGRVPTMVTGYVHKGDMMVSAGNGYARSEASPVIGSVIGKALEDKNYAEPGVIEVVIGRL